MDQSGNWTSWFEENPQLRTPDSGNTWPPQKTTYGLDVSGITGGDIHELLYVSMAADIPDISANIIDISSETILTYYRLLNESGIHHCFIDKFGMQINDLEIHDLSSYGFSSKTIIVKRIKQNNELHQDVQEEIKKLAKRQIYHNICQPYYISHGNTILVPYLKV
jgi:hypothetical protein